MTVTVDWGAVLALTGVGAAMVGIVRYFVRDEIRKVTNGKFARIDKRLGSCESAVHSIETVMNLPHRHNWEPPPLSHGTD